MTLGNNVPELTVSELAFSLKRTLEETYARVRVRGELSKVKIHTSGHLYSDLKDSDSVLNIICWRTTLSKLSIRPEEGLDVICTGRITSYPARSNYQMIVEQIELAGEGALLKLLEDRKKRLAAEGLFDESRKKKRPFLPEIIGVVTSPTGAVIRDILHRLSDRCPRHVIVWPVRVQGDGAATEIAAAITGFNALPERNGVAGQTHIIPRPDLLIVARGGGSLEDLMPFNEESVVRATAHSTIPIISAVGHETDTTLIDFAADLRAPTPTAAAELAVPERSLLLGTLMDYQGRMHQACLRMLRTKSDHITHMSARMGQPDRLLELRSQKLDMVSSRLGHMLDRRIQVAQRALLTLSGKLLNPSQKVALSAQSTEFLATRLTRAYTQNLTTQHARLFNSAALLEALSFKSVLGRGYALLRNTEGTPITSATQLAPSDHIQIDLKDGCLHSVVEDVIKIR